MDYNNSQNQQPLPDAPEPFSADGSPDQVSAGSPVQTGQDTPACGNIPSPGDPRTMGEMHYKGSRQGNIPPVSPQNQELPKGNTPNYWNQQHNNWDYYQNNMNYQSSNNSPYYNQPTHSPYKNQGFAIASMILGILALLTSCTGVFSLPFGAMSLLFAIMAYRKGKRMNSMAVTGISMACIGILSGLVILISSFMMLPEMLRDENYRRQMDIISEQIYGKSFTEMMEEVYGVDLD